MPAVSDDSVSQVLYTKPGSFVCLAGKPDIARKRMSMPEKQAYDYLGQYAGRLRGSVLSIWVPRLLSYHSRSHMATLSYIGDFPNLSASQYFGRWSGYRFDYLTHMNSAFQLMRDALPADAVPNTADYEASVDGTPSSITYLASELTRAMPARYHEYFAAIRQMAQASQSHIIDLPQYPCHRDPNPNNYLWLEDERVFKIVDWETFGMAREGYDEGRLFTYLALNPSAQMAYLQVCGPRLLQGDAGVYFWRVVAMRAFREITSFHSGRYDMRLQNENGRAKSAIIRSLCSLVDMGLREVDVLL